MTDYTNARGVLLSESAAYTRQIWATGTDPLYGPNSPTYLMGMGSGNAIYGGSADDTIYAIHSADRISGGGGIDTVYATVDFTMGADVENLTMDARWSAVVGIGNDSANILKAVNANVTIEGRGGDDVIISAGGDTFVFGAGSGADEIINFRSDDTVRLSGYANFSSFSKVQAAMTQVGADTVLKLSSTDSILFKDTAVSSFTAANFDMPVDASSMKLTFSDDFNSLNLQREGASNGWATAYSWDQYNTLSAHTIFGESEVYVDRTFAGTGSTPLGINPFSVSNGVLTISADPTPDWAKGALWNQPYTSGLITTAGSFEQLYGYFEMRADLPEGKGSFPAFWLVDNTYNEIDVMESVNGGDSSWQHVHYHPTEGSADRASFGVETKTPNLTDGFHTFGVLWTAETLTWYVDGVSVASTATPATMNKPMYMLANYAVGGSWAGAPDGSGLGDMKIDYIRAYSVDGAPVTAPSTPGTPGTPSTSLPDAPAPSVPSTPSGDSGSGATVSIAANTATVVEGDSGTTYGLFTVNRSGSLNGPSTVNWSVSGSAVDTADFGGSLPSGTVFFGGGESSKTIWAPIAGDKTAEGDEAFTVTLSSPSGAAVSGASASMTIVNDDGSTPGGTTPPVAIPAPDAGGATTHAGTAGSDVFTGTAGADRFTLSPTGADVIYGFDSAQDTLVLPSSGFHPVGVSGDTPTAVDVSQSWQSIQGASVVRWTGDVAKVDSLAEVDGTFEAMPGNKGGPAFMIAYTPDHKVGVYYDADPAHQGGAQLVVTLDNLVDTKSLAASDFLFV